MAKRIPEFSGSVIVLVGSFNPQIFQPEWFARQGLLPKEQVEAAEIKVIAPAISHFETEQFIMQVTHDKFYAGSKPNADPAPLRDLVQGTFFILEHTPVTAMGLNCMLHFSMESEDAWHQVGDKLAPKDPWIDQFEGSAGLQSLSVTTSRGSKTGGWREETYPGARYTARIEPSVQVKFGVYFETNENYPAPKDEPLRGLMKILGERWGDCQIYASNVANHILDWAGAGK